MRKLTQKQIDNAPERFDAYYEDGHGNLRLINTKTVETCSANFLPKVRGISTFDKNHYSLKTCKPIPRKPFDINQHSFSYAGWELNNEPAPGEDIMLYDAEPLDEDGNCTEFVINADDADAIAKHFGIIK